MSNNEFKDNELEKFKKRFSGKFDHLEESFLGVEFKFRNSYYRVTRQHTFDDNDTGILKKMFHKTIGEYEVIKLPIADYPEHYETTFDIFIGVFDTIDDLLENFKIDDISFKDIVTSNEAVFLGFD